MDVETLLARSQWRMVADRGKNGMSFIASGLFEMPHVEDNSKPTMATDGAIVLYNKDFVLSIQEPEIDFTRIHEPKHLHPERKIFNSKKTLLIKEYSIKDDRNPYYPINDEKNRNIHRRYKFEADKIKNFSYGGRLADYAYYDMDMTISAALKKFDQIKKRLK